MPKSEQRDRVCMAGSGAEGRQWERAEETAAGFVQFQGTGSDTAGAPPDGRAVGLPELPVPSFSPSLLTVSTICHCHTQARPFVPKTGRKFKGLYSRLNE